MGVAFITQAEVARGPGWNGLMAELVEQRRAARLCIATVDIPGEGGTGTGAALWVAAERLPQWLAVHPGATPEPALIVPDEFAQQPWNAEDAAVDLLRARMTGRGPTAAADLAATLALPQRAIDAALLRLEADGYVMRGRFTSQDLEHDEWCERHLLARIHRYTLGRLRREIEPVEPRDFMRFLFDWQRVAPGSQATGPEALTAVLALLEGFEAAAGAWETELLPARVADYDIRWLDELSMSGRLAWTRLRAAGTNAAKAGADSGIARANAAGPLRSTPIVLLPRRQLPLWSGLTTQQAEAKPLSSRAQLVADWLREHGASFFDELVDGTRLLRTELENALAELVALGWSTQKASPAGARCGPSSKRPATRNAATSDAIAVGIQDADLGLTRSQARRAQRPWRHRSGHLGTHRAHVAAPLRRGRLAPARTRSRVVAAMARTAPRLPPAGGPRRDPRRPLHRRHRR